MRKLTVTTLIGACPLAACAAPGREAAGTAERAQWHRDAPGSIWKHNRIPDGH